MSHRREIVGAIGVLQLVSGLAGIAVGGTAAAAGWWLVVVGLLLTIAAWRDLGISHKT